MTNTTTLQNLQSQTTEAKPKPPAIIELLASPGTKKAIESLASKFFTPERFLRLCVNAITKTPRLAECSPKSVLGAFMAAASLGLEPNTAQQQAFLIPYKKRANVNGRWVDTYDCQFQIGYRGYISLAYRSDRVISIDAEAIHEGDTFEHMQGSDSFLKYAKKLKDRGPLIGAFCHVRLENGGEVAVTLSLEDLHRIRSKSESYTSTLNNLNNARNNPNTEAKELAKAQKSFEETPWAQWEDPMAAKSAIKQLLSKKLSLQTNDALQIANKLEGDPEMGTTIDMGSLADPEELKRVLEGEDPKQLESTGEEIEGLQDAPLKQAAPVEAAAEKRSSSKTSAMNFTNLE